LLSFETLPGETLTLIRKGAPVARDLLVHFKENKYYWGLNSKTEKGKVTRPNQ
jgi:hypothetical protein